MSSPLRDTARGIGIERAAHAAAQSRSTSCARNSRVTIVKSNLFSQQSRALDERLCNIRTPRQVQIVLAKHKISIGRYFRALVQIALIG